LLDDFALHCRSNVEILLTQNLPEAEPDRQAFPLRVIRNTVARGFAANHNAAFDQARGSYFCVLNPDIRMPSDPFPELVHVLADPQAGVAAPLIVNAAGMMEDSARPFPTVGQILEKAIGRQPARYYDIGGSIMSPDWVAGMFMLFRTDTFRQLGGFDSSYHLYYEDVDLCARLRAVGYDVRLCPATRVVHHARRESRRNLRYFTWHLSSMLRWFLSRQSRYLPRSPRLPGRTR
jgi:GT2 family glycosyltransferase